MTMNGIEPWRGLPESNVMRCDEGCDGFFSPATEAKFDSGDHKTNGRQLTLQDPKSP